MGCAARRATSYDGAIGNDVVQLNLNCTAETFLAFEMG